MGAAIFGIILYVIVAVSGNNIGVVNEDITVIESKEVSSSNVKENERKQKLPHYYAEEVLCELADSTWDVEKHDEIINDLVNKEIKLTGKVSSVHNNFDGCYITFNQRRANSLTDGWAYFSVYFYDDDEIEKVLKLEKGDTVTITGHTGKYKVSALSVYDCHLK